MLLFFYFGFLTVGVVLITLLWLKEKTKTQFVSSRFIRDKLSEFLKITPWVHKIETLEKELPLDMIDQQSHSAFTIPELNSENGWKAKHEKLEALFQEKSAAFGKIEGALNNEIKNRASFEDFKYLLEEEIKKGKEKRRQLQAELASLKTENENLRAKLTERENQVVPKFKL